VDRVYCALQRSVVLDKFVADKDLVEMDVGVDEGREQRTALSIDDARDTRGCVDTNARDAVALDDDGYKRPVGEPCVNDRVSCSARHAPEC